MKVLIIYKSMHHQNTYRLVKHLHDKYGYDLINVDEINDSTNFDEYIYIGIASGIYGFEFSKEITELIKKGKIKNKKMFILYTSAMDKDSFSKNIIKEVSKENELKGVYHTKGFCTFAFFKWFGGVNKNRPNENDLATLDLFIDNRIK